MQTLKSRSDSEQSSSSKVGGKQNFNDIYNQDDPRSYYRTLGPLDYRVADYARPIVEGCLRALSQIRGKQRLTILDLCCGYGINGSVLRHSVSMADLYDHYSDPKLDGLSSEELAEADRRFFADNRRNGSAELVGDIVGLDVADRAVRYAEETGLIDRGAAINLEREDLPQRLAQELAEVDIITVTGGMGYVTDVTFRKLLEVTPEKARPWILSFPLRGLDLARFDRAFADFGLETEAWDTPIPQRRFADDNERERTLQRLKENDIDARAEQRDGRLYAHCYLARPAQEKVSLRGLVDRAVAEAETED